MYFNEVFLIEAIKIILFSFCFTALAIWVFLQKRAKKFVQPIREDGPSGHLLSKKNTPTLGGAFFIFVAIFTSLIFSFNSNSSYLFIAIFFTCSFAIIGLIDDLMKIFYRNSKGLRGSYKISLQFTITAFTIILLYLTNSVYFSNSFNIKFFSNFNVDFGFLKPLLLMVFIVGISNATNLTDGLDGLLAVPAIIILSILAIIVVICANLDLALKYHFDYISNISSILPLLFATIGGIFGFLIFNFKPAKIFMGDVGSLAIGGLIAITSAIVRQEFIMIFACGLFIIEALSVILQVASYKIYKKRIFLMAPIHHHFEKKGWSELRVVFSFWAFALFLAFFTILLIFNY